MAVAATEADTRDRLLRAAAELLVRSGGEDVSTRAICERAGVRSPTLYHHFGNKQNLLDAVVSHGLREFLASSPTEHDDPIERIRQGWDLHVRFGLENPSFYALVYGRARPGQPCAVVAATDITRSERAGKGSFDGVASLPATVVTTTPCRRA